MAQEKSGLLGGRRWRDAALGGLVVLALVALVSVFTRTPTSEAPAAPAAAEVAACSQAAAGVRFEAARRDGVIRGVDLRNADGPVVLVSARRWRRLDLAAQEELVAAVDCGIAGPGKHLTSLKVREDRSGPDLWALNAGELSALRRRSGGQGAGG